MTKGTLSFIDKIVTSSDSQSSLPSWHALPLPELHSVLATSPAGLSADEVERRRVQYGRNVLSGRPVRPAWRRFFDQCNNVLIAILLAAAIITGIMGHTIDAAVIGFVILVNTLIGFIQEGRAEQSLRAIGSLLTENCLVMRDGQRRTVAAQDLVPGDVVFMQSGDRVPADLRLVHCKNLHVDESALTGESLAVSKHCDVVNKDTVLAERRCMVYSGTFVTVGQATGVVVATAQQTELGRIQHLMTAVPLLRTPLLVAIDRFSRQVSIVVFVIAVLAFVVGITLRGYGVGDMFLIAVALAVAAIPEGLPAVLSITLAIGVQRMAKRNAIIRRLPAVDTLGAISIICTDKTGTVTRNEMMVVDAILSDGARVVVGGDGYAPTGVIAPHHDAGDTSAIITSPTLLELARCGLLCSDGRIVHDQGEWRPVGDPIEAALASFAMKCGLALDEELAQLPRADVIPFEAEHRFMATLHRDHRGGAVIYVKGAPEVVFSRCATTHIGDAQVHTLANQGRRVLAFARKRLTDYPGELTFAMIEDGLEFLGLIGAIDPPRDEATAAIAECHAAGIRVAMITGDHAVTAQAIARELGLNADRVLTGAEIDNMTDADQHAAISTCEVYARVSPEHKLRIVQHLQAAGHTVAMTGDGVNDAPALRRAHIGVAMGCKGTEVAKEAADVVLTDDNFASITAAVREGRTVFDNIRKTIHFILPVNGAESMVLLLAILLGFSLPLTPVQILWVNLISSVTLALALAFEPAERDLMHRRPRAGLGAFITWHSLWRILFVSLLICLGTFVMYAWQLHLGNSIAIAQTAAVNLLVFCEMSYLFCTRSIRGSLFSRQQPARNPALWIAVLLVITLQLLYTYTPLAWEWFGTAALGSTIWFVILAYAAFLLISVEIEKYILRRYQRSST